MTKSILEIVWGKQSIKWSCGLPWLFILVCLTKYNVGSTLPTELAICMGILHKEVNQYFKKPILKLVRSYMKTQFSPKFKLNWGI